MWKLSLLPIVVFACMISACPPPPDGGLTAEDDGTTGNDTLLSGSGTLRRCDTHADCSVDLECNGGVCLPCANQVPVACTGTPASCAERGEFGCRHGCDRLTSCGGNVKGCQWLESRPYCEARKGCYYGFIPECGGRECCRGTPENCETYGTDRTTCLAAGCYQKFDTCEGFPIACEEMAPSDCRKQPGCTPIYGCQSKLGEADGGLR